MAPDGTLTQYFTCHFTAAFFLPSVILSDLSVVRPPPALNKRSASKGVLHRPSSLVPPPSAVRNYAIEKGLNIIS